MIIECEALADLTITNKILVFGLVRSIMRYSKEDIKRLNLSFYCFTIDQFGTIYKLYSDYDPCLKVSYTVAVPLTNEEVKNEISSFLNEMPMNNKTYLELYNTIAKQINIEELKTANEIYTEKNKQNLIIDYISAHRKEYKFVFT